MLTTQLPVLHEKPEVAGSTPFVQSGVLNSNWLRALSVEAGADDVGFVELSRRELDDQRDDILDCFPQAKSLISFVVRMNREPIRSPARSIANLEFHRTGDDVNDIARRIVMALEREGVRAVNPAMGFPMEMDRFPGKLWVVSHKPVAVAAGLGQMGIHRNVIHPTFGSFILLGTIVLDTAIDAPGAQIDYNPCFECKLCVAACPTGAIGSDGHFDFSACYTHNYREFMGGFTEWVERVADSPNAKAYRRKVNDAESASMWQSLSYGANYKAAYCLAVCPAGKDVIGPFTTSRKAFTADVVKPLQSKEEPVYVIRGSDAEQHVTKRFPHKQVQHVGNSLRPQSIKNFLDGLPILFQRNQSAELCATYQFTFTGKESRQATVVIKNKTLAVHDGHVGTPDLRITADSNTWIKFLAKDQALPWALLRRKIRLRGSPLLLFKFGKCFLAG
ncbi:SCP2 sterol-binding domain-containing protein [Petrachloros mirabilis]